MQRKFTDLVKIFAKHVSDELHRSRLYEKCSKINQKVDSPIKKIGKIFKQTFQQREYMDGKPAEEKTLDIISHQGNAN